MYPTDFLISICLVIFLYAETHYSFKGIYNRLKRKEPEIIADTPHRMDPGSSIPILIFIKDSHLFPIELISIQVELGCGTMREMREFEFNNFNIQEPEWYRVLEIKPPDNFRNNCKVNVTIIFLRKGKRKRRVIKNDNYVGTSHAPLDIFISDKPLPKSKNWYFGEFHFHSNYTNDQVEFGAPLDATSTLAKAMGLSFFCVTDHSYDLDDVMDNYLINDPELLKWKKLKKEIQTFNTPNSKFTIVPGEEVSAGNGKNQNIHLLVLNPDEFIPGAGDSAEKWLQTKPNQSIEQILNNINSESVAFAAHPGVQPPFLQRLFVRRGKWNVQDCSHSRLHGLQIWNGTEDGLQEGRKIWIKLLLEGIRIFISGGNDAHGNFNRFRQIGFPFFTMRENHQHIFGKIRTGVFVQSKLTLQTLLEVFKEGRMIITNGPFANIWAANEINVTAQMGNMISGTEFTINSECLSTPEFGFLKKFNFYSGNLLDKKEYLLKSIDNFNNSFEYNATFTITKMSELSYIRAELYTDLNGKEFKCLTNPIWLL